MGAEGGYLSIWGCAIERFLRFFLRFRCRDLTEAGLRILISRGNATVHCVHDLLYVTSGLYVTKGVRFINFLLTVSSNRRTLSLMLTNGSVRALLEARLNLLTFNSSLITLAPVRWSTRPIRRLIFDLYSSFNDGNVILIAYPASERILTSVTVNCTLNAVRRRLNSMVRL